MRHICVACLTIIASDNGLSPSRCQAIIWTNAGILLIRPLGTNFSEIVIEILTLSFKKMHLKMSSAKRRPFCLGLNELSNFHCIISYISRYRYLLTSNFDWGTSLPKFVLSLLKMNYSVMIIHLDDNKCCTIIPPEQRSCPSVRPSVPPAVSAL